MLGPLPDDFQEGDELSAAKFNQVLSVTRALNKFSVAAPLQLHAGKSGVALSLGRMAAGGAAGPELNIFNNSGEEIPPFGCMAVVDTHENSGTIYFEVDKPSTTFHRQYLPNGPTALADQAFGTIEDRRHYRWLYNTGTPANDEGYGPTPGEWYLTLNYPAVTEVVGIYDATDKLIYGTCHTIDIITGKLAGTLTVGSSATVNVWSNEATPAVIPSLTLTTYDWLMRSGSITSGTKVVVTWIGGRAIMTEASCGP